MMIRNVHRPYALFRVSVLLVCLYAVRGLLISYRFLKATALALAPIIVLIAQRTKFGMPALSRLVMIVRHRIQARVQHKSVRQYLAIFLSGGVIANACSSTVWADGTMTYLDVLENVVQAFGYDVSNSGSTVVGTARIQDGRFTPLRAVKWDLDGSTYTMTNLGTLDGGSESEALSVSADGSVVTGYSYAGDGHTHAFKWTAAGGMVSLGTMGTGDRSYGSAVSADGSVIVGSGTTVGGSSYRAFRWTSDGGMVNLGSLVGSYNSSATAVNDDGSVVAGDGVVDAIYTQHAFRWTQAGGMQDLGTLVEGTSSHAKGISGDGTTVVGYSGAYPTEHAFRWTLSGGTMDDLGTLNGASRSVATAVNHDGTVVVGYSGPNDLEHAFRWTLAGGTMVDLGTLPGDDASYAYGVSADGNYVVGSSYNDSENLFRAFIWHDGVMQDYTNLLSSFPLLATATEVAMQDRADWLSGALDNACVISTAHNYCLSLVGARGKFYNSPTSGPGWSGDEGNIQSLSFGMKLSEKWSAGVVLASGRGSQSETVDASRSLYAFGGFARWSETGQDDLHGFNLFMNAGWARGDQAIFMRGQGVTDVEVTNSTAAINSFSTSATVSYGLQAATGWLVSPYAGLRWQKSDRAAYSEDQSTAFYASYAAATSSELALLLGVNNDLQINQRNHLRVGLGVEYDLAYRAPSLTGVSNIPVAEEFDIVSGISRRVWRGVLNLAHVFSIDDSKSIALTGQVSSPTYGSQPNTALGLAFNFSF